MKQWKDGDKFSGNDYTSERNVIKDTIIEKDVEADVKNRKLFIYSENFPEPQYVYENLIWFDPRVFYVKESENVSLEINFDTSFLIGFSRDATQTQLSLEYELSTISGFVKDANQIELELTNNYAGNVTLSVETYADTVYLDLEHIYFGIKSENAETHADTVYLDLEYNYVANISLNAEGFSDNLELNLINAFVANVSMNAEEASNNTDLSLNYSIEGFNTINAENYANSTNLNLTYNIEYYSELNSEQSANNVNLEIASTFSGEYTLNAEAGLSSIDLSLNYTYADASFIEDATLALPVNIAISHSFTGVAFEEESTYLVRGKAFNASAVVEVDFSDTNVQNFYFPSGATITIRNEVPEGTSILLTPPLTVDNGGTTYEFEKWRLNSSGSEISTRVLSSQVNNDEIYELYYQIPVATPYWQITFAQSFVSTLSVFSSSTSNSAVLAALTSAYSPGNYPEDNVYRVQVYDPNTFQFLATKYAIRRE